MTRAMTVDPVIFTTGVTAPDFLVFVTTLSVFFKEGRIWAENLEQNCLLPVYHHPEYGGAGLDHDLISLTFKIIVLI